MSTRSEEDEEDEKEEERDGRTGYVNVRCVMESSLAVRRRRAQQSNYRRMRMESTPHA